MLVWEVKQRRYLSISLTISSLPYAPCPVRLSPSSYPPKPVLLHVQQARPSRTGQSLMYIHNVHIFHSKRYPPFASLIPIHTDTLLHRHPSSKSTHELDVHLNMPNILDQLSSGTLNGNDPRLDSDGNTLGDGERFDRRDILHCVGLDVC